MFFSKNDFFKLKNNETETQRISRLKKNLEILSCFISSKKINKEDQYLIIQAYNYFVANPNEFDGATLVKDVYDISNLEISAMLHDYQYIVLLPSYSGKFWFRKKKQYDKQYYSNLITFRNITHKRVAQIRYKLLRISTPLYWLIKKL